jgi:transposase
MPFYSEPPPPRDGLTVMNPLAAGIDIGDREIYVAVPPQSTTADKVVRSFGTFTNDLVAIADWLKECGVTTAALESTGIYWVPLFELLDSRGFKMCLVDTRRIRIAPGRKSDVLDSQWLQQLHSYGLLTSAFRPAEDIVILRSYMRQRQLCLQCAAEHIQHMQKSLQLMNIKLSTVVNDITGVTGMKIIRQILDGQRDPLALAKLRDGRCHADEATIAKSLRGNWREDHLFALRQAVELYDVYRQKILACDQEIERVLQQLPDQNDGQPLPDAPRKPKKKNSPAYDAHELLHRALGVNLLAIEGIDAGTALVILSEIGTDLSAWPTANHFASWLGLAPRHDVSGGRVLRRGVARTANRVTQALRMSAQTLSRAKTALGAFYRRMRQKGGGKHAVTATAHKLAKLIYNLITKGEEYVAVGEAEYEKSYQARVLHSITNAAFKLGYNLVPNTDLPKD